VLKKSRNSRFFLFFQLLADEPPSAGVYRADQALISVFANEHRYFRDKYKRLDALLCVPAKRIIHALMCRNHKSSYWQAIQTF
jgi:hypothetical protein